jgi:sulfatase modifying factor 1
MNGKYMANVWQGNSITETQGEDGFVYTSPVGHFGYTESGLSDMGGNVWNWCEDTFKLYPGNMNEFNEDPQTKVMRGGSFFFDQNLEKSYTVTFRAPNTSETSLFNIGFRCASNP